MEEEARLQTTESIIEEFYENMEAPKFVDFTLPDPCCPNDREWFCTRVGCDQKHEEEIDPEAIYNNFVLRVMAARSPNIKHQKTLNGRNMSGGHNPSYMYRLIADYYSGDDFVLQRKPAS